MRRWMLVVLPSIAVFIALSFFVERRQALMLVTGGLLVATIVVAVCTKDTAAVRGLLATLLWSIVLFELLNL